MVINVNDFTQFMKRFFYRIPRNMKEAERSFYRIPGDMNQAEGSSIDYHRI